MLFFLFSFSDPVKSFKTNSGPILRQANAFEREKVVGRHSSSARQVGSSESIRSGRLWHTLVIAVCVSCLGSRMLLSMINYVATDNAAGTLILRLVFVTDIERNLSER